MKIEALLKACLSCRKANLASKGGKIELSADLSDIQILVGEVVFRIKVSYIAILLKPWIKFW